MDPLVGGRRIVFDFQRGTVALEDMQGHELESHPFGTARGLELAADAWLRAGWDAKYVYGFTWLGRPVIQLPDDLLTLQELVWSVRPDVIIEVGVAHGGSAVFFASLCRLAGRGRVIAVEIELRPHNRAALDIHPLRPLIEIVDGDSIAPTTLERVRSLLRPGERCIVVLDGLHTRAQVLAELRAYGTFVDPGSYLVAMDGIAARLAGAPRSEPDWGENNPAAAVEAFLRENRSFVREEMRRPFGEGVSGHRPCYFAGGILKRIA